MATSQRVEKTQANRTNPFAVVVRKTASPALDTMKELYRSAGCSARR
ncbi:MAG: hypothetical protein OJF47_001919 [Nitrospira sp.]|nr:MAG: hypothetical protein OJF47_001919 [Nitrospira sp.]